tara:strand:+ start:411 stop:803 length:393 start_codon:yes stop_codon:yes gene_type:complete
MKLTKSRLKQIIKEEISVLLEVAEKEHEKEAFIDIAKKESEDGVFVDLVSLVGLIGNEEGRGEVKGIDMSTGAPRSMTIVASITKGPATEQLSIGQGKDRDKVFVPSNLLGQSFGVAHPEYGKYNFIVQA